MGDNPASPDAAGRSGNKTQAETAKAAEIATKATGAQLPAVVSVRPHKNHPITKAANRHGWWTNPIVLNAVHKWASEKKSQRTIAAWLGKTLRTFEAQLAADKGENALRLAYESGCAEVEQTMIDMCMALRPTDPKLVVAWIFFMKAQFGWKDRPDPTVNDAPKINFILPGSMSEEDYYKKLGLEGPIDTRAIADRTSVPDMKDVTPGADGKLPTKVTTGESHILSVSNEGVS